MVLNWPPYLRTASSCSMVMSINSLPLGRLSYVKEVGKVLNLFIPGGGLEIGILEEMAGNVHGSLGL